jgi:hypothetical protein
VPSSDRVQMVIWQLSRSPVMAAACWLVHQNTRERQRTVIMADNPYVQL